MTQRYFDVNMRFDIQPPLRTSPGQRMSWPIVATFDVVSHLHPEVVRQHIRASQAKLNIWNVIDSGLEEYEVELSAALVPVDDGQNFQLRAVFPDVHIDSTGGFFLSVHGVFSMLGDPNVRDIIVHLDVRVDVEEGSPEIHKYSPAEIGFLRDNYQSLNMTASEMEQAIKRRLHTTH
ncbi:no significant blast hit [Histoplasma capsulatum var. duboisii H88]|nr:no significant blast hit [Histoplasma capsulatum var. duboisii H88]